MVAAVYRHLKRQRGFTLIELLVAMSVLAIVISVGAVAIQGSLQNGRNGKRRGDLKALQNALEQYYAANSNAYPMSIAPLVPTYLKSTPTDPKHTTNPNYIAVTLNSSAYNICADLEGTGTNNNGTDQDLCITNQQ